MMETTTQHTNLGLEILSILHRDHINMSKLLTLLEKNVQLVREGEVADLRLMAETIEYIGFYADIYHHPLEDVLYDYFRGKSVELTALINHCTCEHVALNKCTQEVLAPLSLSLLDGVLPLDEILDSLDAFLLKEKQHINFEEAKLFPKIEALASAENCEALTRESWQSANAMFEKFDLLQYQSIYEELAQALNSK